MKIWKNGIACHKRLALMASDDETRFHLKTVHMDKELKKAVTTDGHRLYATKYGYSDERAGQSFKIEYFAANGDYVAEDCKYPNVRQIVPSGPFKHWAKFEVPEWLGKFEKPPKKAVRVLLDTSGEHASLSILSGHVHGDGMIGLNAAFLAPFAGEMVTVFYNDANAPIMVTPLLTPDLPKDYDQLDWFSIIMPVRLEEGHVDIIGSTKTRNESATTKAMEEKMEPKGEATVLSIVKKLKEKEERSVEKSKLKCCECSHEVESLDDWDIGMDLPPTKDDPAGAQDSGIYICPKCDARQDFTVFDGLVKLSESGDLESTIPGFLMDDLTSLEDATGGSKFNVGTAIINAVRMDLLKRYGEDFIEQCFPAERAWLKQKLEQMKEA